MQDGEVSVEVAAAVEEVQGVMERKKSNTDFEEDNFCFSIKPYNKA